MEDRRRARLLTQKKQSRPKKSVVEGEEESLVERSGVTSLLSKKDLPPCFSAFSPSSPHVRSLQAPHKQWQHKPVTIFSSEITSPGPFSDHTVNLERKPLFQLVFLGDADQSVEVEEVEEVDFVQLKTRLNEGKSVFITRKENEKVELLSLGELDKGRDKREPWYTTHV